MKKLTVNADDLGLSPAVNEAICRLAEKKRLQSASLMSLGHLEGEHLARLRASGCELGLHLDLTTFAIRQHPAIGGNLKQTIARAWLRRYPPQALRDLIRQQLERFETLTGAAPVFIDGHQHVHQFPQIREALLSVAAERYPQKPALRVTRPITATPKAQLVYRLGGKHLVAHSDGWQKNRNFGGVYNFCAETNALCRHWQRWLAAASGEGTVIMCHPALPDSGWQDDIKNARETEWHWLSSEAFAELWQAQHCQGQHWQHHAPRENPEQAEVLYGGSPKNQTDSRE